MADENVDTERRLQDLEALARQALEVAKHHGPEHAGEGADSTTGGKGVKYIPFGAAGGTEFII
jgi:hypothetical protein